jgi:aspartate aminotransferase
MPDDFATTLSPRVARLRRSPTAAISERLRALRAEGRMVDNLGEGELDFETPPHIRKAAHDAIDAGDTKYTAVGGTPALKAAIVRKFKVENGLDYDHGEVIAGTGAKSLILNAMLATLSDGDEVVVPAPYWVSYPDMVSLADGTPVVVKCEENARWKLRPETLEAAIGPKTRWLILNSPNNPTGAVYGAEEFSALARVLLCHPHVMVLADDIYEHLRFEGPYVAITQIEARLKSRTLLVNGVSKGYSMTGWRVGYAAGPERLIAAMEVLQSQSTSNPTSISQAAAAHALEAGTGFIDDWVKTLRVRRDIVVSSFNRTPGLRAAVPEGAFYVFANVAGLLGCKTPAGKLIESDLDVATYLLDEAGVGVVHGAAFGASPYIRVAYALDTDVLRAACVRIRKACEALVSSKAEAS